MKQITEVITIQLKKNMEIAKIHFLNNNFLRKRLHLDHNQRLGGIKHEKKKKKIKPAAGGAPDGEGKSEDGKAAGRGKALARRKAG